MTGNVIIAAWIVIGIVWALGALRGKATARREPVWDRVIHMTGTIFAAALLIRRGFIPALDLVVLPRGALTGGMGLMLTLAGIALAIWARVLLGTNWSGLVTVKEGHELMRSGPYSLVRHPIYTGILTAILGTAVAWGELRCFVAFAILLAAWIRKLRTEERFLAETFGEAYLRYQREVNALVPWFR